MIESYISIVHTFVHRVVRLLQTGGYQIGKIFSIIGTI